MADLYGMELFSPEAKDMIREAYRRIKARKEPREKAETISLLELLMLSTVCNRVNGVGYRPDRKSPYYRLVDSHANIQKLQDQLHHEIAMAKLNIQSQKGSREAASEQLLMGAGTLFKITTTSLEGALRACGEANTALMDIVEANLDKAFIEKNHSTYRKDEKNNNPEGAK